MGKSVLEYLGVGVAIAGAGICIAGTPGLAYAETETGDPPSISEHTNTKRTDDSDTARDDPTSDDTDQEPADEEDTEEDPAPEESEDEAEPAPDDDADTVGTPEGETAPETPEASPVESPTEDEADSSDGYSAGSVESTRPAAEPEEQEEAEITPAPAAPTRKRSSAPEITEPEPEAATATASVPTAASTMAIEEADASVHTATAAGSAVATATPNPVVTVLAGVLTFLGLNTPEAPSNPLGALVWGLFRRVETALGVVPRAGDTTVSAPTSEGVVTGDVGFDDAGLPLTYSSSVNPDYGTVLVNPDGTFSFTPTRAARLAAGVPGTNLAATITVTAANGLAATNTTLTVPVSPYEPGTVIDTVAVGWFVNTMALSPDGSYLYVTATDVDDDTQTITGTVKVVDTATGTVLRSIPTGTEQPLDIAFTPDGAYAYATMPNDTVLVINRGHAVFAAISTNQAPTDVAVTPDGKYAYVPNSGYPFGYVAVIDTATQTKIGEIPIAWGGTDIAIADTSNGALAYITENGVDGTFTVKVIDTGVNIVVDTIGPLDIPAGAVLTSPDGSRVYISTNSADGVVYVIDTDTNSVESTIQVGNWISAPVLSPDGAYLYVVSEGKVLRIDTATNTVVGDPITTVTEPLTLAVSADGSLLYIASSTSDTLSVVYTGNRIEEAAV
ncbi:hypothetical protein BH11ACT6_BH11ACT6_09320 [soil metagenome]